MSTNFILQGARTSKSPPSFLQKEGSQLRISNMLFAKNRLRKKKDFERVMKDKNSRALSVSFLAGRFLGNGSELSRIGFVVSKKVSKKAVQRNKAKRRLREAARFLFSQIKPGFDIVIFTKPEIAKSDFKGIKQNLEALFKKAGLWKT